MEHREQFTHIPVLLNETIDALRIKPDGIYVDGTAGGGGHSYEIASRLKPGSGRLIAADRDPDAVEAASLRLKGLPAEVIRAEFADMKETLFYKGITKVNGILLDLGVSSHQLDAADRGFSYRSDAPLDMRMSQSGLSAEYYVNEADYDDLRDILYMYGEEKFAPQIAKAIVKERERSYIGTTSELSEIIKNAVPAKARRAKNPCRKTFQALRIAVNDELGQLDRALDEAFDLLLPDGVLAVITFHSLEDRMVKRRFADFTKGCTCPPDFPQCVCGKKPLGKLPFRKPIVPSETEISENPRSRSAKLRAVIKL